MQLVRRIDITLYRKTVNDYRGKPLNEEARKLLVVAEECLKNKNYECVAKSLQRLKELSQS